MLSRHHVAILKLPKAEGSASIASLAAQLGVSPETVRRDVKSRAETGRHRAALTTVANCFYAHFI